MGFLDREAINHFVINSSNQSFRSIVPINPEDYKGRGKV